MTELTWNLEALYPGFGGRFEEDLKRLDALLAELRAKVEGRAPFREVVSALDAYLEALAPLSAYVYARYTQNTLDEEAVARLSEFEAKLLDLHRLRPLLVQYLAEQDPQEAGPYRILVEEAQRERAHQMSLAEEVLAAEMSLVARQAWAKLHESLTSQITAPWEGEERPISFLRNLAFHKDEAVRKAAYEVELKAWERHELPLAFALNGVKGEAVLLNRKRGYQDDLEPTLHRNRITRPILEALLTAMREALPLFRRYFGLKAKALGKPVLDWWDLFAPLGEGRRWSYEEGMRFIVEHLGRFSPQDAALAQRAFEERWIDVPPRKGKVGGAFCMGAGGEKSLILTNFEESFEAVSTLAHELGHAYHNFCLARRPPSLREVPMTLAETASIMNETVVVDAALQVLPEGEGLLVLDGWLTGAAQVVVDIYSRFLFESWVFAARKGRELSGREFKELMVRAQDEAYGEALRTRHPYMWAVKGHYYGSDFYNYPYAFGLLFGLALYETYRQEKEGFLERYEDLLASSGQYPAKELGARFGFDLESPEFWRKGVRVIQERVEALEARL
ncbi:M3 family oligoendopeptidase [Thermus filiformis]|uniref:Oligoendopeptidase F n=1 Tax=Thermus filiformis TaxID=276 RepID=A0A0A2WRW9_THEFI|nr:M3 family oligoendopeptidase [Thermus filiformis]KGQ22916.1 oligoendopeptidase F [Thermus filiformis]